MVNLKYAVILLLLMISQALAAEGDSKPKPPKITFPKPKVTVQPTLPDPNNITLEDEAWYVVESDVELVPIVSPSKSLKVMRAKGPATLAGLFVDGNQTDEVKTFNGPFVTMIRKAKGATGQVDVAFVPKGFTDESVISYKVITLTAPQPPPTPIVDPPVVVPPQPPVVTPTGFRVLMLKDTSKPLTVEQEHIFNSTQIMEYLNTHCVKDPARNHPEWRAWDVKTLTIGPTESATMVGLWNSVKGKLTSYPKLVIAVNGEAKYYDFPATEADTLNFLKSQGGN